MDEVKIFGLRSNKILTAELFMLCNVSNRERAKTQKREEKFMLRETFPINMISFFSNIQ
jgi:hypothetical protein